ncbi:DMT family transporter [Jatrophihabitans fulvus]
MEAKWRWLVVTAFAPVMWGAVYYVTKHYLPAGAPLWGAALRALPAGLLLLAVARRLPHGSWWWRAPVLGLINFGAFFVLIYVSAQLLPTSIAASVMALAPVVLMIIAWPLVHQRPTTRLVVGAALGITGVVLVVQLAVAGSDLRGVAASLTALLLSSLGALLTTRWRDDVPLVATTSWQLVSGGTALLVVALVVEGGPPSVDAPAVTAYAGVTVFATAVAFLCWFTGLRHLPAGMVGLVGLLNPVTGIVLGVSLGGETLTPWQGAGIALVLGAIVLGRTRVPPAPRPPVPPATPQREPTSISTAGCSA